MRSKGRRSKSHWNQVWPEKALFWRSCIETSGSETTFPAKAIVCCQRLYILQNFVPCIVHCCRFLCLFQVSIESCCTCGAKAIRHEAAKNRGPMTVVELWCFPAIHVNVSTSVVSSVVRFVTEICIWFANLSQFFKVLSANAVPSCFRLTMLAANRTLLCFTSSLQLTMLISCCFKENAV